MTVFSVKPIKPKKLRVATVRLSLLNALRKEGRLQVRKLKQTTQHWKNEKPTFEFEISLAGGDAALLVGPSGSTKGAQKWIWIDEGTKAHIIKPRRAKMLRFKTGFRSGSTPNTLKTTASTTTGNYVSAKQVRHPGIKARNWSYTLLKERYKPWREEMNKALKAGLEKGGWN